jgi:hypothetical protein
MFEVLAVLLFSFANQDFLEFAQEYQDQGYTWEYVGKTPAEPGYPHLEVMIDEKPYFFYQLFAPEK